MPHIIPAQISAKDPSIDIHIAGPGFGEGILIVIGKTIVIGIDSCTSLVQRRGNAPSYLEQLLENLGNNSYVFWILTHFHSDHFQALSSVLDQFSRVIQSIVIPLDYTEADLWYNVVALEAKDASGTNSAFHLAKAEYGRIRTLISEKSLEDKFSSHAGSREWLNTKLRVKNRKLMPLQIDICGPSPGEISKIIGRSTARLLSSKNGKQKSRAVANHGSYIVHLRFGRFEGFFLGDANKHRTEQLFRRKRLSKAEITCLKVAHHGASDGTSKKLLDAICDSGVEGSAKYALVTPFNFNDLPKAHILNMLRLSGFDVTKSGAVNAQDSVSNNIAEECKQVTEPIIYDAIGAGEDIMSVRFSA